ncbi:MAG TPA: formate dehydrogenase accessory protein FdhE [Gemmatimonadales bacterium]|nr:formate dehydrogenase accessory protein FdhE [Gemmatimonadales bacterium]
MNREAWLAQHPYLQAMGDVHSAVERAAAEVDLPDVALPAWEAYLDDYRAGVPLLQSSSVAIDLDAAAGGIVGLAEKVASLPLPDAMASESRALASDLQRDPAAPHRFLSWLQGQDPGGPSPSGLLHYLAWAVLARYLRPVVRAFGGWRDEERWLRSYCPTCGTPPAMAQLVGKDPGRQRYLVCGCCRTRWRYKRTDCPFCENDDHQHSTLAIEGESNLRIDYCESCGGYLKTYNGEGSEGVFLADWTSVHLDLIARDRGLKRMAASMYAL